MSLSGTITCILVFKEAELCISLHCWIWIHCCWILLRSASMNEANTQRLWHSSEASATLLRQWKRHQDRQQPSSALEDKAHSDPSSLSQRSCLKEDIDIIHVSTEEQLADIFTKPLDEKKFCKLRCELNILESSNVMWSCTHPNTYASWWLRCANTRSNVYLQLMKTYTLSVNTLTWNLTSERHNNCAPCLGLILPIRWVTPPPNFCLEYFSVGVIFAKSSHLVCLQY